MPRKPLFVRIKKMTAKILIVDDEPNIIKLIEAYLKPEGYQLFTAADGVSGLKAAQAYQPDLIVLDIMLPGIDGLELLSRLRRQSDVYVILLTAKSEEVDKIVGLSVGADDYLTKPFSPRELAARIKAALRRIQVGPHVAKNEILKFNNLTLNQASRQAWIGQNELDLTATEFDLLMILAEHPGRVLSREQLLEKIWGHDYYGELRVVDVHVGHLRQKIGDIELIATVRGVGYRFDDEVM